MAQTLDPAGNSGRVQSLFEQAELWAEQQQWTRARLLLLEAVQIDQTIRSRCKYAALLHQLGEETEAIEQLSIAGEIGRRKRQFPWVAEACARLAVIHRDRGEWAIAKSFQQQAISARFRCLDPLHSEDFLALANDAILQGDLDHAEQLSAHAALACSATHNFRAVEADAWGLQGTIALLRQQPQAAWRCFLRAYSLHCRAWDDLGRLLDLLNLAAASRELGFWDVTKRLLIKAKTEAGRRGNPRLIEKVEHELDSALRVLGVASRKPEWN